MFCSILHNVNTLQQTSWRVIYHYLCDFDYPLPLMSLTLYVPSFKSNGRSLQKKDKSSIILPHRPWALSIDDLIPSIVSGFDHQHVKVKQRFSNLVPWQKDHRCSILQNFMKLTWIAIVRLFCFQDHTASQIPSSLAKVLIRFPPLPLCGLLSNWHRLHRIFRCCMVYKWSILCH